MGQKLDREKMRWLRKELGLSQGDAANAAGFSSGASQWSDVENGRKENVTIDTLNKIAVALKCDARELITERQVRKQSKKK